MFLVASSSLVRYDDALMSELVKALGVCDDNLFSAYSNVVHHFLQSCNEFLVAAMCSISLDLAVKSLHRKKNPSFFFSHWQYLSMAS